MKKKTSKFVAAALILSSTMSTTAYAAPSTVITSTTMTDQQAVSTDTSHLTDAVIKSDNTQLSNVKTDLTLPTSGTNGTTITWTSSKSSVVETSGSVHRPTFATGDVRVTLTAKVTKGSKSATKNFSITVKKLDQTPTEAVAAEKQLLTDAAIKGTNRALNNVTSKLSLLTAGTTATHTTITWESDNTDVVATDGTVHRPGYADGDATVTLTATIHAGEADGAVSDTKTFTLTVKKNTTPVTDADKIAYAMDHVTDATIKGGNIDLQHVKNKLTLPTYGANGVQIQWVAFDPSLIDTKTGNVARPDFDSGDASTLLAAVFTMNGVIINPPDENISSLFTTHVLVPEPGPILFPPFVKVFNINVIKSDPKSDTQIVSADKDALQDATIKASNQDLADVMSNLKLSTSGTYHSRITWSSSNTAVISNTGTVHRPAFGNGDASVTLTATITHGTQTETKQFTVTVLQQIPNDTAAVTAAKTALTLGDVDLQAIVGDLTLPTTGAYGTKITWSSSNPSVVATDGKVTRPATDDANVTLTATVTKGHATPQKKTFDLKVLKLAATDADLVAQEIQALITTLGDTSAVTSDLDLPVTGDNGTTVSWSSDNTAVVTDDGQVTRPDVATGDVTVNLTATVTKNGATDQHVFTVTIKHQAPGVPTVNPVGDSDTTITGTADTGTTITVKNGDTTLGTATTAGGTFTVTIPKQTAGTVLTIVASDEDGNVQQTTVTVADKTAPDAPTIVAPTSAVLTKNTTQEIQVKAEAGSIIQVYNGSTVIGQGTGAGDTAVTIVLNGLADGTYHLTVTAKDAANNTSTATNVQAITVDTTAPTVVHPLTAYSIAANGGSKQVVFSEQLSAAAKTNVETAIKNSVDDVAATDLSFAWDDATFTLTVTNTNVATDASFYIDATADLTDLLGNTSSAVSVIKVVAPTVSGLNNYATYTQAVTPTFSNATATLSKDNGTAEAFTSGTTISADGVYVLTVTDSFGNATVLHFTIDATAPVVSGVTDNTSYNTDVTPRFREGDATLTKDNGTASAFTSGTTLSAEGSYVLRLTDAAGNATTVHFVIDKTAPVVTGVVNGTSYNANVTVSFNEGSATLDGTAFAGGVISSDGDHTLVVTDAAGNTTTVNFTIDKTAPTVNGVETGTSYKTDVTATFADGTATLAVGGGVADPYTSGTPITAEGSYHLVVTDAVGNTTTINFTLDKTAPVVTGVSNGNTYTDDVTVSMNEGNATLDGDAFAGGVISAEGDHTLVVTDAAGNVTTVHFTIDKTAPSVNGVESGKSYNSDVTATFADGTATLEKDGESADPYTSGTAITAEGSYELVVTDTAGNATTIDFSIDKTAPVISGVNDSESYSAPMMATFNEGTATLDGADFAGGIISTEGEHTLVVTDAAGNFTTLHFTIDTTAPVVSGVENGKSYNNELTATFTEGSATLAKDGGAATLYISGTTITAEGSYQLFVIDGAGNATTVNFAIDKTAPVVSGVLDQHVYANDVIVTFDEGAATLDGVDFTSGDTISTEGNHTLVVTNAAGNTTTVHFSVDKTAPVVTGVTDGHAYRTDVTANFTEGTATLAHDGGTAEAYTSGTAITAEGAYVLVVTDAADHVTTVHFTIDKTAPVVTGVEEGLTYNTDVHAIFADGTALLAKDGGIALPYMSNQVITADGDYTLTVTDTAGNATTVNFKIDTTAPTVTGVTEGTLYNSDVNISFSDGQATLDGHYFAGGIVSTDGVHTLDVTDEAGNTTTVSFSIDETVPVVSGVVDGDAYNTDVEINFNEGTATLVQDGGVPNAFTSGSTVSAAGTYELVVTDAADNVTTVDFTIDKTAPVITGVTENGLYNTAQSVTFDEGNATLDGDTYVSGTSITTDGHHDLVVTDAAGNTSSVHFTIDKTAPTVTTVGTTTSLAPSATFTVSFSEQIDSASKTAVENAIKASVDGVASTDLQFTWNDTTHSVTVTNTNATQTALFNVDATASLTDLVGNSTSSATILKVTAPTVSGVNNYSMYNHAVTPTFTGATATLSKDGGAATAFTSGTAIGTDGTYTLVLTDVGGNTTSVSFTIDTTAPTVGGVVNGKLYSTNVTPRFREGTATLSCDGGAPVAFTSGTQITAGGSYHLVVTDAAGNATAVDFTLDKTAPVANGVTDNGAYKGSVTPGCADDDLDTVTLTKDGTTVSGYTLGTALSLEGHYVLTLSDVAGNVTTVHFTIDNTAPKASVSFGANGLSVIFSDSLTTATAELYLENSDGSETDLGNYLSGTVITTAGDYRLVVTDAAGNQTQVYFTK